MPDNIQDLDLKDELIAERKVGFFKKPDDMSPMTYKIITNIDKFSLFTGRIVSWIIIRQNNTVSKFTGDFTHLLSFTFISITSATKHYSQF